MNSPELVLLVGLACIFLALIVLLSTIGALTGERRQLLRSLSVIGSVGLNTGAQVEETFGERVVAPVLARLTSIGRNLTPVGRMESIRQRLDQAGNPTGWDAERILASKVLGLILGGVVGLVLPAVLGKVLFAVGLGLILAALGFFLPDVMLSQMVSSRRQKIQRALPDAMDMLIISVESGLSFDAAVAQVSRKTTGPLADELSRTLREMQLSSTRMEALRSLAERNDVRDLRGFVTAMVQADAFGIPIANVLRVQAKEMRVRRRQNAEERAQKVPIKMVFPLVFCILPALMIVIVGPAVINISHTLFSGHSGIIGH
jgi:tight adherence protein C